MNEDVLLSAIQSDFTVDLLAHTHDRALFGALRRDVWHFVHWESVHGDHAIAQYHVPRFVLAEVLDGLLDPARPDAHVQPQEQGACELLWRGVGICVKPGNRIALTVQQTQIDLPGAYCEAMLEDVAVLIAARNLVTAEGDLYVLPTQDTHHGNPVAHPARQLIEAIAFEGEVRGQFEAHEFALYSAFCTQRDFSLEEQISLPSARDAVEIQFGQFDVEDIPADVMDAVLGVQDALFPGRIWGPGIAPDVPAARLLPHDVIGGHVVIDVPLRYRDITLAMVQGHPVLLGAPAQLGRIDLAEGPHGDLGADQGDLDAALPEAALQCFMDDGIGVEHGFLLGN